MKKALKGSLAGCTLVLFLVALGTVIGGDVTIQEGTIEGEVFKSTGCTATGTKAIAFGLGATASGDYSTAMGYGATASGDFSIAIRGSTASAPYATAIGVDAIASAPYATAVGNHTAATADFSYAVGLISENSVPNSLTVGFGTRGNPKVQFRVQDELVTVNGVLHVNGVVWADDYLFNSSFYDKQQYGRALDHLEDSSKTIKTNAEGKKEYNHEADPVFLKRWMSVKDYDKYTEEEVWDDQLNMFITKRTYETHEELVGDLGMLVAWLRQSVYELRQENATLKGELAAIKKHVGME